MYFINKIHVAYSFYNKRIYTTRVTPAKPFKLDLQVPDQGTKDADYTSITLHP